MSSPIHKMQEMASDSTRDLADLLRFAKVVASKLKISGFREWIDLELNGYGSGEVPEYRVVWGKIKIKNPYHGLQPVVFDDPEYEKAFCEVSIRDPIKSLQGIVARNQESGVEPITELSSAQTALILQQQNGLGLPPIRVIPIGSVIAVLDRVRTTILDWSLRLEEQGVLGEGLVFNADEQRKATAALSQVTIGNFQGVWGNVSNSPFTQNLNLNVGKGDFGSLQKALESHGVLQADIEELRKALVVEQKPQVDGSFGPKVGAWLGAMAQKAATGAWKAGLPVGVSILASAIRLHYGLSPQ